MSVHTWMFQVGIVFIYLANWLFAMKYLIVSLKLEFSFKGQVYKANQCLTVLFWFMIGYLFAGAILSLTINTLL